MLKIWSKCKAEKEKNHSPDCLNQFVEYRRRSYKQYGNSKTCVSRSWNPIVVQSPNCLNMTINVKLWNVKDWEKRKQGNAKQWNAKLGKAKQKMPENNGHDVMH